jgi:hypothetical protein
MTEILKSASEIRGAFLGGGAVGPANAKPGKYLGEGTVAFERLLERGVIREASPGNFYLYEAKPVANRILRQALFWIFVIVVPVSIIQFCPGH